MSSIGSMRYDFSSDTKPEPLPTCSPSTSEPCSKSSTSPNSSLANRGTGIRALQSNSNPLSLPIGEGWIFRSFTNEDTLTAFRCITDSSTAAVPGLRTFQQSFNFMKLPRSIRNSGKNRRGWPRPGPGPRIGRKRASALNALEAPFMFALVYLLKEAVHVQQLYDCSTPSDISPQIISFAENMTALNRVEAATPVSQALKKKIWTLCPQLGVPAFLLTLSSTPNALAMYMLPGRPGNQWCCTYCVKPEIQPTPSCQHAPILLRCLEKISSTMGCTMEFILDMLTRSAAFHHIPELTTACFYGDSVHPQLAVIRSGLNDVSRPIDHTNRIHIVRRFRKSNNWRCVALACSGVASQRNDACPHTTVVHAHIQQGIITPFSNLSVLQNREVDANTSDQGDSIDTSRHVRPMIPSDRAFQVHEDVNRDAQTNSTTVLKAAGSCHCGCDIEDEGSSSVLKIPLRVETTRCHANYLQEIWTCKEGHQVLPEEDRNGREGLLWISRDTAFTEVFLFDMLLHMVLGGTTISSQADIRSQLFFLQTEYPSRQHAPRSHHSIRKALTLYAMSVVKGMEDWVFRCQKCAVTTENGVYYDKLSFDGQQIGFNIKHDVRYDFYGNKAMAWRRPIDRCSTAWQAAHLIESHALRTILTETLRVRQVPAGCDSVNSLCRLMLNVPLQKKESIRAAVAAIKLFDEDWSTYVPTSQQHVDDSTFQNFRDTENADFTAHPFHFISRELTPAGFNRAIHVKAIFRAVIDARKAAAILAVLLVDLRQDLKQYFPPYDASVLEQYATSSRNMLNEWLLNISQRDSWSLISPAPTVQALEEAMTPGIAEHAVTLHHPYRPPWSWIRLSALEDVQTESNMICKIRDVGIWRCPPEASTRILLMLMALFNEPVSVWLRCGNFDEFNAAVEVLSNAELFSGQGNNSYHYRAAMLQLQGCVVMYEGIMGIIGANVHSARAMHSALRDLLLSVTQTYEAYCDVMNNSHSRKDSMFSPKDFDNMLLWTGAVQSGVHEHSADEVTSSFMKDKYERMASFQSKDFLQQGVWAPDFPIRRPSPANTVWGSDPSRTERSCSKKFDVHTAFSPGTFGGFCLCKHAKTVLVMFLKQPEGCRMPLNFVVERSSRLPRYMIYDFACGMQKAALGISKTIVEHTSFVIDPFHFPGHKTCSLAMHQSSYSELRGRNTESQEQRNSGIRVMERTLRACRDVHFMHFVVLAHGYLNLKAMFQDHNDEDQTEWGTRAWMRWVRDNLFSSVCGENFTHSG